MINLEQLRAQREDAEAIYQEAMRCISHGHLEPELIASALGYHREVCALYNAELSLISSGTLNPQPSTLNSPTPL
jgi:hypothetical protein